MQLHLCVAVVLSLVLERLNIVHCMKPRHNLILHMQSQADRVQVEIDETTAKLAEVAGRVAAAAETVLAAVVHHPELQWEQAASAMMLPKLGVAKDLFDKDKRLRDFK